MARTKLVSAGQAVPKSTQTITSVEALDAATETGTYLVNGATSLASLGVDAVTTLMVMRYTTVRVSQIAVVIPSGVPRMYVRTLFQTTWSAWQRVTMT